MLAVSFGFKLKTIESPVAISSKSKLSTFDL